MVGEVGSQVLEQQHQRDSPQNRAEQRAGTTEQGHDQGLERDGRSKGNAGVDIGPARSHDGARDGDEHGADGEQQQLGRGGVDAHMGGHGLVLADHAQRQTQARAVDEGAQRQHQGQHGQQLPVDIELGDLHEHIAAQVLGDVDFPPGDELLDQLGQAEAEDHKVHARQPQRGQPHDQGHDQAHAGRNAEHGGPGQGLAEHGGDIGAHAEEGDGGQRDIARGPREQRPGRGQHAVHQDADHEREVVLVRQPARQQGKAQQSGGADQPDQNFFAAHRAVLPNKPVGLNSSTSRNTA